MSRRLKVVQTFPKELLINLTLRELRGKYKRSTLGWLWSIINPVANIAIYSVVFGVFLKVRPTRGDPSGLKVYALFLVCGLLPWTFLSNALGASVGVIVGNEGLIKKVYFPRAVLPAATVLAWFASYGVELIVLGAILMIAGNMILPWIPVVIALMLLQFAFVLGIGLIVAAGNAFFRDVQHFLAIFLNVWFYATPILYPPTVIPEHHRLFGATIPVRVILNVNPMTGFVRAYRDVLYDLRWPSLGLWGSLAGMSAGTLLIGALIFRRLEPALAEEL